MDQLLRKQEKFLLHPVKAMEENTETDEDRWK